MHYQPIMVLTNKYKMMKYRSKDIVFSKITRS